MHGSGTIHGLASPPQCSWANDYPNAIGPNAIYDAQHSYYAVGQNILWRDSSIHSTPFNQGQGLDLASHPYVARTVDGFTPFDKSATDTAYVTASVAYDTTSRVYDATTAAYGTNTAAHDPTSAAYSAGINLGDPTESIWPPTNPISASISYDHGVTNINPSVYPPIPNPTLAPGTITAIQAEHNSAGPNTNTSRPRCPTCNTTFKCASDLARHQKKHQPDRPFRCLVPGCGFNGAYRKDKLNAHVRSCHRGGVA